MFVRVVIRLALSGLMVCGAASTTVWGQASQDSSSQAPQQRSTQATPDFSGRWVLEKVDPPEAPAGGFSSGGTYGPPGGDRFGGRPPGEDAEGGARRRRAMPPMEKGAIVTITQSETELVMKFGGHERVYELATPEAQATPQGEQTTPEGEQRKRKSRTYWEGTNLVTETEESFETSRETVTFTSREVRSLSDDGRAMTVETMLKMPRGERKITQVFRRRE